MHSVTASIALVSRLDVLVTLAPYPKLARIRVSNFFLRDPQESGAPGSILARFNRDATTSHHWISFKHNYKP